MDPELSILAATAATTVVEALTSAAWEQTQAAIGALWHRVHPDRARTVEAELAETRTDALAALLGGDERAHDALVGEWQGRLRRLLAADPELADELRRLVDALRNSLPRETGAGSPRIDLRARASGHAQVNQAGGSIHIIGR
ncbi:hypothetical protein ACPXCE_06720 [Streptomyces sp. DT24]|uniref:hypothetical protein n=1 Tax=unclassified Streptomyces TaxID=2593676 RepID=UPI003CF1E596